MAITNKQRLNLIAEYIRDNKYVDLHTLSQKFETSLSTVRRALNDLEAQGIVRRHHGGASLVDDDPGGGYDFITQDDTNTEEKHRIADYAANKVKDGMTVMLDGGTTTYAVAKILVRKRVIVITNSLPIAALLNEVSACETIVTGGTIYNRLGVLYGPSCEASIREMHADLAILGCAGFTKEGVWNNNTILAGYQQQMVAAASNTIFLADSSKFGKRALSLCAHYQAGIGIVTTAQPDENFIESLKSAGSTLELC